MQRGSGLHKGHDNLHAGKQYVKVRHSSMLELLSRAHLSPIAWGQQVLVGCKVLLAVYS